MKKILLVVVGLFFLCVQPLWADEASRRQLAKELLTVMNTEQQFNQMKKQMKEQMEKSQTAMMTNIPGYQNNIDLNKKMEDLMDSEMSWAAIENDYLNINAEIFTDEELQGIINFYKSDVGQKFVQKMPEMMKRMMEVQQKRMLELQPKIQALTREVITQQPAAPSVPATTSP